MPGLRYGCFDPDPVAVSAIDGAASRLLRGGIGIGFEGRILKWSIIFVSLCLVAATLGCGSSKPATLPSDALSGNWEISLQRHAHPGSLLFSGFMLQSGSAVTGSMILGGGCNGVGTVAGTVDGQNLALTINEFGQEISLTGTLPPGGPSGSTFISGPFSALAGGCATYASTGTWSATQVAPISGTFHGTFVSAASSGVAPDTFNVTGSLTQGPNTGSSNATLTGTLTATGAPHFCPYLTSATIKGFVSGTSVTLNLFDSTGSQIAQVAPARVTTNGGSLTCSAAASGNVCYSFPPISNSCPVEQGAIQWNFP